MAGLSVLLEEQRDLYNNPQIISKTSILRPSPPPPPALLPSPPTSAFLQACFLCKKRLSQERDIYMYSAFLQACFLCKKRLSQERDIYMYRGDRAFCSVECRCRQIFMDEEEGGGVGRENCSLAASPTRQRKGSRRRAAAATSGFAY